MVLREAVPYKRTLHPPFGEQGKPLSYPFQIRAFGTFESVDEPQKQILEFFVPSSSVVGGLDLTGISLSPSDQKHILSYSVFMQLLDGQGRASAHPFPLVSVEDMRQYKPTTLSIPLHNSQKVKFFLLINASRTAKNSSYEFLVEGKLILSSGGTIVRQPKLLAKILSWVSGPWTVEVDYGRKLKKTATKRRRSPEKRPSTGDAASSGSEIPQLLFAGIAGGDDES